MPSHGTQKTQKHRPCILSSEFNYLQTDEKIRIINYPPNPLIPNVQKTSPRGFIRTGTVNTGERFGYYTMLAILLPVPTGEIRLQHRHGGIHLLYIPRLVYFVCPCSAA